MRLPCWFVCSADASGCIPGQHRAGRPGGREGPGAGAQRGEDTRGRAGRSRDGALQVGRLIARKRSGKYRQTGRKVGAEAKELWCLPAQNGDAVKVDLHKQQSEGNQELIFGTITENRPPDTLEMGPLQSALKSRASMEASAAFVIVFCSAACDNGPLRVKAALLLSMWIEFFSTLKLLE